MKISPEVEAVAKALEAQFHKENKAVCDGRDGGPHNCWRSMISFARVAIKATKYPAIKKKKQGKITDKMRLSIFVLGFRLVAFEGSWWIARRDAGGDESLMVSVEREAEPNGGYFKSPMAAIDSFLRLSRLDAAIRAGQMGK